MEEVTARPGLKANLAFPRREGMLGIKHRDCKILEIEKGEVHGGNESREKTKNEDRTQVGKVWLCHSEEAGIRSYKQGISS